MEEPRTFQELAKQCAYFLNPDTLAAFSFEICLTSIQDKAFLTTTMRYLMRLFTHCKQRHSIGRRIDYGYETFIICPIICVYPEQCFKFQRISVDNNSNNISVDLREAVDAGKLYSSKLTEITEFFMVGETVEFHDIPETVTEGLVELAYIFHTKYKTWHSRYMSGIATELLNHYRRLEELTVKHDHPVITALSYTKVEELRKSALKSFGKNKLRAMDNDVLNSLKGIAISAHNNKGNLTDPARRMQQMLIIHRVCKRIHHYRGGDALREFVDHYLIDND